VPSRTPDLLDAGPEQPPRAAHVLIEAAQLEGDMVQGRVRSGGDRDAVVPGIDPHEPHHLSHRRMHERVRQREAEVALVEGAGARRVCGVDDDVRQADRDGLAFLDLPVLPDGHAGTDLDSTALIVEEAEAVPAAGCGQCAGLADQPYACGREAAGEGVDVGRGPGAEGDEIDPLPGRLAQPDDILLR